MTTLTYYCTPDDVRRWLGTPSTDLSDADVTELIKMAEVEVDTLTHTTFLIVQSSGTATSGTTSSVADTGATWTASEWISDVNLVGGYAVWIYAGTNSGQVRTITANTSTALTVSPVFPAAIDNTSKYRIIKNTYVAETFTGDGSKVYFTDKYPLLSVSSLIIDGTTNTISALYKVDAWGKLELSSSSESTLFSKTYPLLNTVKYFYGVYPLSVLVREYTSVIAAVNACTNRIGGTYTFASSYTIPDMTITKGEPYPAFVRILDELQEKREWLQAQVLAALIRPTFG
jgi:hypothetical protein